MAGMIPVSHSKPAEVHEGEREKRLLLAAKKMAVLLSLEQIEQFAVLVTVVHARAVERRCEQTLIITVNEHGFPRRFKPSDDVYPISPPKKMAGEE